MTKTETLNLRVSTEFKRRLVDEAAKEKRSVTNYLEVTLAKIWERRESKGQRKLERNPLRQIAKRRQGGSNEKAPTT